MKNIKNKIIDVAGKLEKPQKRMEELNMSPYSDEHKQEKLNEFMEEFKNEIGESFNEIKDQLAKNKQQYQDKIQDLNSGDYDKRAYYYQKAKAESDNYDNLTEFIKNKADSAADDIEKMESNKVALEKARAGQGDLELIKAEITKNLPDKEYQARKELKKYDIYEDNIKGAESAVMNDLDKIKQGNYGTTRKVLISYSQDDGIDQKAEKKIHETIK